MLHSSQILFNISTYVCRKSSVSDCIFNAFFCDLMFIIYQSSVVVFFFIEFRIISIKFVIVVYPVFRYYRMLASFLINVSSMF